MIGRLPKTLIVNGTEYEIRTDYRDCLRIFEAAGDPDLTHSEKLDILLRILYVDSQTIPASDMEEALQQAVWFLDCGRLPEEKKMTGPVLYDWEYDEQIIFAAVNKVAGREVREAEYMHFWTFISYFHEIGDGLFSTVLHIREKKRKGKLEQHEREFYQKNKALIDLPRRYSREKQEEMDWLNQLLNG